MLLALVQMAGKSKGSDWTGKKKSSVKAAYLALCLQPPNTVRAGPPGAEIRVPDQAGPLRKPSP